MAKSIIRPSKADLQQMRDIVANMLLEKNRQGDYSADAPAIRLILNAVLMLFKHEANRGDRVRGKIKARKKRR